MPTFEVTNRFQRDWKKFTPEQKRAFRGAVAKLVEDLEAGRLRKGLRVKAIQGATGVYEMTWADDGRATFEYGDEVKTGKRHIVWRRCGTHDILSAA